MAVTPSINDIRLTQMQKEAINRIEKWFNEDNEPVFTLAVMPVQERLP